MPQPTPNALIHALLLWTTILSIIQVGFIILFFTGGHHGLFQNKSNEASGGPMQCQAQNPTSPSPENRLLSGEGKMLTFRGTEVNSTVKWIAISLGSGLISEAGDNLTILKDGYYFLTLQVTLSSCDKRQGSEALNQTVSLMWERTVLLQGMINRNTCSTGLLGKVKELFAGGILKVTINPAATDIDSHESLTHLDVIYMLKT